MTTTHTHDELAHLDAAHVRQYDAETMPRVVVRRGRGRRVAPSTRRLRRLRAARVRRARRRLDDRRRTPYTPPTTTTTTTTTHAVAAPRVYAVRRTGAADDDDDHDAPTTHHDATYAAYAAYVGGVVAPHAVRRTTRPYDARYGAAWYRHTGTLRTIAPRRTYTAHTAHGATTTTPHGATTTPHGARRTAAAAHATTTTTTTPHERARVNACFLITRVNARFLTRETARFLIIRESVCVSSHARYSSTNGTAQSGAN